MAISLSEVLELDIFDNTELLTGQTGLNREVSRINFMDCPVIHDEIESSLTEAGDLYLLSLYIAKDDDETLIDFFKSFINSKAAGVLLIDQYFTSLPENIITYANANDFPIILIDKKLSYAEITTKVMELILIDQSKIVVESKIDTLINGSISPKDVISLAKYLNNYFSKYYMVAFIKVTDHKFHKAIFQKIKELPYVKIHKYKNRFFITMNASSSVVLNQNFAHIKVILTSFTTDFHIGFSNVFSDLNHYNIATQQSYTALELELKVLHNSITSYKDLSLYKLLYPLKHHKVFMEFYEETIALVESYDVDNNSNLMQTAKLFIKNGGNYSLTSKAVFQHENTVRYRIAKVKEILAIDDDIKFFESFSIALKVKEILEIENITL